MVRGPGSALLVYVDDATGKLMELRFCEEESTWEYFTSTRRYVERHGRPVAFYSDKASVFRVNAAQPKGGDGVTQFGRAMSQLNVDVICANTPAAKGRVERAHHTLQDRLVKELRLRGVSNIEQGNAYLPEFMADYNERFGRPAQSDHDAHRPLGPHESLETVFLWKEERKVSKNLTVHYKRVMYLLEPTDHAKQLRGRRVMVRESEDGTVAICHGATELPARAFPKENAHLDQGKVVPNKLLGAVFEHIRDQQIERDRKRLAGRLTKREKRLIQQRYAEAAE